MVGELKLYLFFVLFPQLLWLFFSHGDGFYVTCESCSFPFLHGNLSGDRNRTKSGSAASECGQLQAREDEVTAKLCSCSSTSGESGMDGLELTEHDVDDRQGGW